MARIKKKIVMCNGPFSIYLFKISTSFKIERVNLYEILYKQQLFYKNKFGGSKNTTIIIRVWLRKNMKKLDGSKPYPGC